MKDGMLLFLSLLSDARILCYKSYLTAKVQSDTNLCLLPSADNSECCRRDTSWVTTLTLSSLLSTPLEQWPPCTPASRPPYNLILHKTAKLILWKLSISDVTIIEIEIEIVIFWENRTRFLRKIEQNRYLDFWSKCDSITVPRYRPRLTGDRRRRSQNGFYTRSESNHAECGGVYISANPITLSAE